jgi:hypothetical protein
MDEDLSEFLPDDGPGVVSAVYKNRAVKGIHERQFLEQLGVQTSAPTLLAKKADFSEVAQEETIVIGTTAFRVASFEHDPMGFPDWTLLALKV